MLEMVVVIASDCGSQALYVNDDLVVSHSGAIRADQLVTYAREEPFVLKSDAIEIVPAGSWPGTYTELTKLHNWTVLVDSPKIAPDKYWISRDNQICLTRGRSPNGPQSPNDHMSAYYPINLAAIREDILSIDASRRERPVRLPCLHREPIQVSLLSAKALEQALLKRQLIQEAVKYDLI